MFQQLTELPRERATHHWADYVELLTLTHIDGEFSPADLLERWDERDDLGELQIQEGPDEDDGDEGLFDAPPASLDWSSAARRDRRHRLAGDVFEHLLYRADRFGDSYPFEVQLGTIRLLRRRVDAAHHGHQTYLFLLLASCLRYIQTSERKHFTSNFEQVAAEMLSHWLPPHAEVHVFGTASASSPAPRYTGTLLNKAQQLAADLREELARKKFSDRDSGDGGLDLVAWLPTGDDEKGVPTWFAQATCRVDWQLKQYEPLKWNTYIPPTSPRGNLLFIPFCFRQAGGAWHDENWVTEAVIIDRARFLWLTELLSPDLDSLPQSALADALAYRLEVV